jgi:hypothetical protein
MKIKTIAIFLMSLGSTLTLMSPMARAQQTKATGNSSSSCPPNTIPWNGGCVPVKAIPDVKAIPSVKGIPAEIASNIDPNTCWTVRGDVTVELICRFTMSKDSFEALTKEH